jgi:hypothetical protein
MNVQMTIQRRGTKLAAEQGELKGCSPPKGISTQH